jgi:membrane protein
VWATVGWMLLSVLFSWYVAHFGSYDRTYGSLGAVVGFLTWIWLSLMVLMLGAELNNELEKRALS